jgi:shikimate dehydrogenase
MINATPMGLKTGNFAEIAYRATSAECVFYDMIYARDATPFIAPALTLGRRALDGAGMLVNQGALAFELFNDVSAPAGVMRTALMAALGRQTSI